MGNIVEWLILDVKGKNLVMHMMLVASYMINALKTANNLFLIKYVKEN